MAKLSVASPLQITESFLCTYPPEAIRCGELHVSIFTTVVRTLFNSFLSELFFLGESQKPSVSLLLGYESAVTNTTAKEASLPTAANGSTDHGLPRGFQRQQIVDFHTVSSGSSDHGQHRPLLPASSLSKLPPVLMPLNWE
ncbi:hypothetical protein STEG23_022098 [Scotinomys teguina]